MFFVKFKLFIELGSYIFINNFTKNYNHFKNFKKSSNNFFSKFFLYMLILEILSYNK